MKETIEEAAEKRIPTSSKVWDLTETRRNDFIAGALWQQEQMFELMNHYTDDVMAGCNLRAEEWVKQIYKAKL